MEKRVNRFTLIIITIIDALMFVGYIADFKNGNISFGFMLAVIIAVLGSMLADYVVFLRNKSSNIFKHVSVIGYMLVYALAVLGAHNDVVFTILFPITIIFILYYDYKLVVMSGIVFGAINVLDILYTVFILKAHHSGAPLNSTTLLLQGATTLLYLFVVSQTTKISNANNSSKLAAINEEKEHNAKLLSDVLHVVSAVKDNSTEAQQYIDTLSANISSTADALNEISIGNSNNTESIEQQNIMTTDIQDMIVQTKNISDDMKKLSDQTAEAVNNGQTIVKKLQTTSAKAKTANEQVVEQVKNLLESSRTVGEITNQISDISAQTNMLSLNASIESARAGDAGRGFAVVAEEIRKLADETKSLTESIQEIVFTLQSNADAAKETVDNVLAISEQERELVMNAGTEFENIGSCMASLNSTVTQINEQVDNVYEANNTIVDSISRISAVSQEVASSTESAVALGDNCLSSAKQVESRMNELMQTVQMIDKYSQE